MMFYICNAKGLPDCEKPGNNGAVDRTYAQGLRVQTEEFNQQNANSYYGFIGAVSNEKSQIIFTAYENKITAEKVKDFLTLMGLSEPSYKLTETTMKTFISRARDASRSGFVEDTDTLFTEMGIDDFEHNYDRKNFTEKIATERVSKKQLITRANAVLCGDTLVPEIERICAGGPPVMKGHPVHYMIQSNDRKIVLEIVDILMSALVKNNRLISKRYVEYKFDEDDSVNGDYRALCKSLLGGAIVIVCDTRDSGDSEYANRASDALTDLAEIARKHRNRLLTIICMPRDCEKMANLFYENAGALSIVTIREQAAFDENAKLYLKKLSKQSGVTANSALYKTIEPGKGYLANDLELIFEKWLDKHLKTHVYKQYQSLETVETQYAKEKPKGSAFSELEKMIGLSSAKEVITQAIDFYKAQKLFREMGIDRDRPAMHMVFTGNPGTAKTTAARLFARIMKENNLLADGDLYEVGRADLVDKYVGGTAPRVKKQFQRARGSVLFIDEAYSLVDDKDGLYGDEAINTIVQEMENARDSTVVIFAGYPDKMEGFMDKNPGLRSRIAFHVNFEDYTPDELYEILELMVANHKMSLGDGVKEKVMPVLKMASGDSDFGNGRFVRNMFEKAKLKQASRLVKMDIGTVTKSDVTTLIDDDFSEPVKTRRTPFKIGFVS